MASALRIWARYASWLLPHGVHVLRSHLRAPAPPPELVSARDLASNQSLKQLHSGERCYVLGNGPSLRTEDLLSLVGEQVFSVSNGYLHKNYEALQPRYHCVPQISYGRMTETDVVAWLKEMDAHLGSAELFLNETEADVVKRHGLFPNRKVHYVAFRSGFDDLPRGAIPDIATSIPRVESVPVMVLMIAMYMGFKEIVLLGVDHDHFRTGRYLYAFEPLVQKGKDFSVAEDGTVTTPLHDEFQSMARLWRQYRAIRDIATQNGVSIVNASRTSELDEFPRVTLDEMLATRAR